MTVMASNHCQCISIRIRLVRIDIPVCFLHAGIWTKRMQRELT